MPDNLPAILAAAALIVTATGTVIASVAGVITARRSGRIETKVNGAATAMEADRKALLTKVDTLKEQLARLEVVRQEERAASQQARSDVQAERASPAPSAGPREGRP